MLINIVCVGKTTDPAVKQLVDDYTSRLKNYTRVDLMPSVSTLSLQDFIVIDGKI